MYRIKYFNHTFVLNGLLLDKTERNGHVCSHKASCKVMELRV